METLVTFARMRFKEKKSRTPGPSTLGWILSLLSFLYLFNITWPYRLSYLYLKSVSPRFGDQTCLPTSGKSATYAIIAFLCIINA